MIKIEKGSLTISGLKPLVEEEFVEILRTCRKLLGEETYGSCIKRVALTDEENKKETKRKFEEFLEKFMEDKEN
jgi:hypothetical protein